MQMISLRLEPHTERELKRVAKSKGLTQSEYIRQILAKSLIKERETAWELGCEVFGKVGSGRSDLATNRKTILKDKLRAKQSRH